MLPPEIVGVQPYSMGPITGWDPEIMRIMPALGTARFADVPELMVKTCFWAPAQVQRMARAQGVRGIVMQRPNGLAEALERDRERRAQAAAERKATKGKRR